MLVDQVQVLGMSVYGSTPLAGHAAMVSCAAQRPVSQSRGSPILEMKQTESDLHHSF